MSELDPIHGSRHVDIGEQGMDVPRSFLQDCHCLIGVFGLEHIETSIRQSFRHDQPDVSLVFHNDNDKLLRSHRFFLHTRQTSEPPIVSI